MEVCLLSHGIILLIAQPLRFFHSLLPATPSTHFTVRLLKQGEQQVYHVPLTDHLR